MHVNFRAIKIRKEKSWRRKTEDFFKIIKSNERNIKYTERKGINGWGDWVT